MKKKEQEQTRESIEVIDNTVQPGHAKNKNYPEPKEPVEDKSETLNIDDREEDDMPEKTSDGVAKMKD